MIKNYGLKLEPISSTDYVFGASPLTGIPDLLSSGDWRAFLPKYEPQFENYETYGCTVWGGQNQIETLLKYLTGIERNFDEQFNYNIIELEPPGADPTKFYESVRNTGLTEGVFTKPLTLEEFKKPRPMTEEFKEKGRKFEYKLNHEWLWSNDPSKDIRLTLLRSGLKKSPVAIAVTAWTEKDGLYVDNGQPNTHWCLCFGIEGDSPMVFDSYDQSIKKLHPDHHIQVAKIIYLTKKTEAEVKQISLMQQLLNALLKLVGLYKEQIELKPTPTVVYEETKEALKETMITRWAKAIAKWEGDTQGTNPGNLKYTPLTKSWGAKPGRLALDGGLFAIFDSKEKGMEALCKFLTLGCKDELKAFHASRTLGTFMKVYAGNPPQNYINGVAKDLGVPLSTNIKTFL